MQIQIQNLTKRYSRGAKPALDDLSLEIRHGTVGLLGPNGAGKTTLIRILSTQMRATSGTVRIDGMDIESDRGAVRGRLGYLPQRFGAYPNLTAREFLEYRGRLGGLHDRTEREGRVRSALQDVALYEVRDKRTGTFSGGMMRRLGIAQAILTDPDFLIVDEPTVGLDPEERVRFRSILARLSRDRAIMISTHIVGDISSTCEEIAMLREGRLVYHGSPEALVAKAEGKTWQAQVDDRAFEDLSQRFSVVNVTSQHDSVSVRLVGDEDPPDAAAPVAPNLEDAYVYHMGQTVDLEAA